MKREKSTDFQAPKSSKREERRHTSEPILKTSYFPTSGSPPERWFKPRGAWRLGF